MKQYDDFMDIVLDTTILDQHDNYYAFHNTVFWGEKGGFPSDHGWINGQPVLELKWENDTLYHKVEKPLENPIHLVVDQQTRIINTTVQSALHLMDGYYRRLNLEIIAIGVHPHNQWFEVNDKTLDDTHLLDIQNYINQAIWDDVSSSFQYMNGSDYPDPKYHHLDQVRLVSFGDLDKQPCGTPHVHSTAQIQSFVIFDYERTSRGTKFYFTCNQVTNHLLIDSLKQLKKMGQLLNVKKDELATKVFELLQNQTQLKKQIEALQQELAHYQAQEIATSDQVVINLNAAQVANLKSINTALLNEFKVNKLLITPETLIILSSNNKAREIMNQIKAVTPLQGGGSPSLVTLRHQQNIDFVYDLTFEW